jgi:hypothetical protein
MGTTGFFRTSLLQKQRWSVAGMQHPTGGQPYRQAGVFEKSGGAWSSILCLSNNFKLSTLIA